MQRSRGFCHGVVVSKICYNTVIVLSVVLWDCCKRTNTCRDCAFSNSGLEVGLQPFSCPCSQNVTHCQKEICSTCLFKTSIPAALFCNSKHPLPTRSLSSLRAAARSTSSALRLHYACLLLAKDPIPSLQLQKRAPVSCREAKRLVTQLWSPRFVTYNTAIVSKYVLQDIDCALSCDMWLLQTNEQLLRLSF